MKARYAWIARMGGVCLLGLLSFFLADRSIRTFWNYEDAWVVTVTSVGTPQVLSLDMPPLEEGERREEGVPGEEGAWQQVRLPVIVRFEVGNRRGAQESILVEQLNASGLRIIPGRQYILTGDSFADGSSQFYLSDRYRAPWVFASLVVLGAALVGASGKVGLRALGGILLSFSILFLWFIPAIHGGASPLFCALGAVALVSACTVALVMRRREWGLVAFGGAVGASALALGMGVLFTALWDVTGLSGEGGALLAATMPKISLKGILLAGMVLGAVGAVLDVAISITATMGELVTRHPQIKSRRLWMAGIGVGREVLGSMINTLLLAYVGAVLPFTVLIAEARPSFWGFFNDPSITEEMLRGLGGAVGLLFTVPLTTALGVALRRWMGENTPPKMRGALIEKRSAAEEGKG